MTLSRRTSATQWRQTRRGSFPTDGRSPKSCAEPVMWIDPNGSHHRSWVSWPPNFDPFSTNDSLTAADSNAWHRWCRQHRRCTQTTRGQLLILRLSSSGRPEAKRPTFRGAGEQKTEQRLDFWNRLRGGTHSKLDEEFRHKIWQDLIEVQSTCIIFSFDDTSIKKKN